MASSDTRLLHRNGIWYYRRRVPKHLVEKVGRPVIQHSLKTHSKAEAKKLREIQDLKWSAHFASFETTTPIETEPASCSPSLGDGDLLAMVRRYLEDKDRSFKDWFVREGATPDERNEMIAEAQFTITSLTGREEPNIACWQRTVGEAILSGAGLSLASLSPEVRAKYHEFVRRALLELSRRELAVYHDQHDRAFFDVDFDPSRPASISFKTLAEQYLALRLEEGDANGLEAKWRDKLKAHVAFAIDLIGAETPVERIDYDCCLAARSLLSRVPSNRTKLYPGLTLSQAAEKAASNGKPVLSPISQAQYLDTVRNVLDLAVAKRILPSNPAANMRPLKHDPLRADEKRRPFTLEQIKDFFHSEFYRACAPGAEKPYKKPDRDWKFWLPLMSLFMGMRPVEICQMLPGDVKRTANGTWYVDVVASSDDDSASAAKKTLKTATSRRKIPIHPELIRIGFIDFAMRRQAEGAERLFGGLKADKYGNLATYALKRFRDTFLPEAITMEPRQSTYSFRHAFRDGLRRAEASPDTLKALGGWSQANVVSDSYGDNSDPDLHAAAMSKINFPGVDISFLYQTAGQEAA